MQIKRQRPWMKTLIIALVCYFVVLPGVIVIGLAINRYGQRAKRSPEIAVPQLMGMDLKTAEARARDAKLVPRVMLTRWDIPAPIGVIVGQVPEYGQSVPPGTMVGLEVSIPDPNARAPGK